jgi:hypothetical protein
MTDHIQKAKEFVQKELEAGSWLISIIQDLKQFSLKKEEIQDVLYDTIGYVDCSDEWIDQWNDEHPDEEVSAFEIDHAILTALH